MAQADDLEQVLEKSRALALEQVDDENERLLRGAVRRFPENAEVWLRLGLAVLLSTPEESATYLRRAVSLAPTDPWTLTRAASIMFFLHEFDAAQDYVDRAVRAAPDQFEGEIDLMHLRGRLAFRAGDLAVAEDLLAAAFTAEPEGIRHGQVLADLYIEQGRLKEALSVLAAALECRRDDEHLHRLRRKVLSRLARPENAGS